MIMLLMMTLMIVVVVLCVLRTVMGDVNFVKLSGGAVLIRHFSLAPAAGDGT
jgi:hypothetical protein